LTTDWHEDNPDVSPISVHLNYSCQVS